MHLISRIKKLVQPAAERPGVQRALRSTVWLVLDRVVRMSVSLVVGAWVARYLGPDNFGVLSYVLAFVGLLVSFAGLGMDNVVIRDLVLYKTIDEAPIERLLGSAFLLRAGASVITAAASVAAIYYFNPADRTTQ